MAQLVVLIHTPLVAFWLWSQAMEALLFGWSGTSARRGRFQTESGANGRKFQGALAA